MLCWQAPCCSSASPSHALPVCCQLTVPSPVPACLPACLQDTCFAFSQYCRPNQALLAALDGHGPHGHLVRLGAEGVG
jgi:hypothetical protein